MGRRRLLLGLLVLLAAAATAAGLALPVLLGPHAVRDGEAIVRIPRGAGAAEAARRLEDAGVVRSGLALRLLAAWRGDTRRLQAGEYRFTGTTTPERVIERLRAGDVLLHAVTLPEGLSRAETVAVLEAALFDPTGSLDEVSRRPEPVADIDPQAEDLEGYLYPDTYHFPRGVAAETVIGRMVARFREVADGLRAELGAPPGTVREWVTLASLIEAETGLQDERRRVAAVFRNRLERDMPLQCDPTVLYALEREGVEVGDSLARRLGFDHPYNTYLHRGLPPGPIANPGEASLRAALQPAETDELYFVADGNGGHRFSRTLDEHNRAVRRLRQVRREQAAR